MHIYFGCIMLIRNLLQDTVGDIRITKLLKSDRLYQASPCRVTQQIKEKKKSKERKHHRSCFTTLVTWVKFLSKLGETKTLESIHQQPLVT